MLPYYVIRKKEIYIHNKRKMVSNNTQIEYSNNTKSLHRYKFLFDNLPVPIQETNVENIGKELKRLKGKGIIDIVAYIQNHPNFIADLYYKSNIFDVNEAMLELTEAVNKEQYLTRFKEVMGDPCLEFFKYMFIALFNGSNKLTGKTEITTFKGRKIWVEATAIYLAIDGEEIINYTFKDITESKFKNQAIKLINQRLVKGTYQDHLNNLVLALAEAFDLPFVFIGCPNKDNKYILTQALAINHKIQENIEYLMKGTPCVELYEQKKKVIYTNHLDKIFSDNEQIQAWNGKSYLGYPLFAKDGSMIGHFAFINDKPIENLETLQDIMELYAAWAGSEIEHSNDSKALNESQTTLMNVLNNTGDVLYAVDFDLKVVAFNEIAKKGFLNLFGTELEIGKKVTTGIQNLNEQEIDERRVIFNRVKNGETVLKERAFLSDDDSQYLVTTYSPMRNSAGEIIGCVTVSRDRSNLRAAKMRLEDQNATIQKQLESLNTKNQELEKYIESNMQLENFAYIASHDLKAPIRTIISFSQLLKRKLKDQLQGDTKEYLEFIISSSRNMKDLIEDLLTYSRVNSQSLEQRSINVNNLIELIALENQTVIQETQCKIECQNLPKNLKGDRTKLKQLFQNLITNGIKFHKENQAPEITITATEREKDWLFSVADNGIGIEPQYFERIFILFQKLHTNSEYNGTGLGLAICKKIVAQHKGDIWLESTYGEGTTFFFTIAKEIKG